MDITSLILDVALKTVQSSPVLILPYYIYLLSKADKKIAKQDDMLRKCWKKSTIYKTRLQMMQAQNRKQNKTKNHKNEKVQG